MHFSSLLVLLLSPSTTLSFSFVPSSSLSSSSSISSSAMDSMEADGKRGLKEGVYKKVFVAGGTKGLGLSLVKSLLSRGHDVVGLARSPEGSAALTALGAVAKEGDAFTYKNVEDAMWGCDAVITTLGGSSDDKGVKVDAKGNNNVVEAAGILGIPRVVLVTSIGCGDSKGAPPEAVYEVLRDTLAAKDKAERNLTRYYTNSKWTIVRPGGLKSDAATGTAVLTEATSAIGSVHREDVASLICEVLVSEGATRKVLSCVDPGLGGEGAQVEAFQL